MSEDKKVKRAGRSLKSVPQKGEGTVIEVFYRGGRVEQFRATQSGGTVSYALDLKSSPPILVISGSTAGQDLLINFSEVQRFATL